jgi:hypothetical protein
MKRCTTDGSLVKLGTQALGRDTPAAPMTRREDGRDPAEAEHPLDAPLPLEQRVRREHTHM